MRALSRLGFLAWAAAGLATLFVGGPLGFWLLVLGAVLLGSAGLQMGWRWLTRGDELARELAADRRFAAERGVNRLQDRLEAAAEPRAVRALAGLRDLGTRAALLDAARERLAPADAEVLGVVDRMRSAPWPRSNGSTPSAHRPPAAAARAPVRPTPRRRR